MGIAIGGLPIASTIGVLLAGLGIPHLLVLVYLIGSNFLSIFAITTLCCVVPMLFFVYSFPLQNEKIAQKAINYLMESMKKNQPSMSFKGIPISSKFYDMSYIDQLPSDFRAEVENMLEKLSIEKGMDEVAYSFIFDLKKEK